MDIFGTKRIAALRHELHLLNGHIEVIDLRNRTLTSQLRKMDQLVFEMSQCDSWERMRPIFNELQKHADYRRTTENRTVESLVIEKIEKTYGSATIER